jgi:hypothetical protein
MAYTMTWGTALLEVGDQARRDSEQVLETLIQYTTAGMTVPSTASVVAADREAR